MNKQLLIASVLALGLSGCAQQPQMVWQNPTKGQAGWPTDRYACLHEAAQATPPATATTQGAFGLYQYDINAGNRDDLLVACLEARGWRFVPAQPVTSIAAVQ